LRWADREVEPGVWLLSVPHVLTHITMPFHQHTFPTVEQYLHHRPPYLLVERLVSCTPTEVVTEKQVRGDEFYIQGHFPGAPIFPGR